MQVEYSNGKVHPTVSWILRRWSMFFTYFCSKSSDRRYIDGGMEQCKPPRPLIKLPFVMNLMINEPFFNLNCNHLLIIPRIKSWFKVLHLQEPWFKKKQKVPSLFTRCFFALGTPGIF